MIGLVDWRLPAPGPAAVRHAAEAGADALHVDLGGPGRAPQLDTPARLRDVSSCAEATGVRILAVSANCLNDVGLTAAAGSADARRVRDVAARLLDTGRALGAPLVMIPSFGRSAITDKTGFARTCEVLTEIAAQAQEAGLILASENVLDPARARRLVRAVATPQWFRILLDCYNPVAAGLDPRHLVATLADVLADQIHLKDGVVGRAASPLLGAGDAGVGDTLLALRRHEVRVHALVLENDYRDGDRSRLDADLSWARRSAETTVPSEADREERHDVTRTHRAE